MISIIICHTNEKFLKGVSENISHTIGTPYEIVVIDNQSNRYSLCQAYNEGARKSNYDILCFSHEDILFHTNNWGHLVSGYLSQKDIGIIGLCGGKYVSSIPGGWWAVEADYNRQNTIQHDADTGEPKLVYQNPGNEVISDVVVLDGLWMCCRKEVWEKTGFDEKVFRGFHFYDIDFSLQIFLKGYRACVVYDISVEHLSNGSYDKAWLENAVLFGKKWKDALPATTLSLSKQQIKGLEYAECNRFLQTLIRFGFDRKTILNYFLKCVRLDFFNVKNYYFFIQVLQLYFPSLWKIYRKAKS